MSIRGKFLHFFRNSAGSSYGPHGVAAIIVGIVLKPGLFVALFFLVFSAFAQEDSVFAPFPSRLQPSPEDSGVRLTWRDAPEDVAAYRVYRHTQAITQDSLAEAELIATVAPQTESFLDRPEPGSYHYAVIAENEAGTLYPVLIPFRNRTSSPITVATPEEPEEPARVLRSVSAEGGADGVTISFRTHSGGAQLVLYRSTRRIDSADALAEAVQVAELPASEGSYADFPVPGVGYYYALFPEEMVTEGEMRFEAGVTITETTVEVPLTGSRVTLPPFKVSPRSRAPLPLLRISREITGDNAPLPPSLLTPRDAVALNVETENALARLLDAKGPAAPESPEPQILPAERSPAEKGPADALASIVKGPFSAGRWGEAGSLLDNLLASILPEEVRARAHFYRAQTYYFSGRTRQAFVEFLLAREAHYAETAPWIDHILATLAAASTSASPTGGR